MIIVIKLITNFYQYKIVRYKKCDMTINEAKEKINNVKEKLEKMRTLTSCVRLEMFEKGENDIPEIYPGELMSSHFPRESEELQNCWVEIQKIVPPGFSVDSNLIRHLSFNEAHDWMDISNNDIPRELIKINEYRRKLVLIEYIENLHPEVSRISQIVLNGDIDAALKTVYSTLDSKIRVIVKPGISESTVPAIGKAFKEGRLSFPSKEKNDAVRNFLQGVLGYYRGGIIHNPLPPHRNSIDASLPLFCLADETFKLLDICCKK
jgi:hypothetical protein